MVVVYVEYGGLFRLGRSLDGFRWSFIGGGGALFSAYVPTFSVILDTRFVDSSSAELDT